MNAAHYAKKLRRQLAAVSLPTECARVEALFRCLLTAPPDEQEQVADLVTSIVATLTNPHRRQAMWKRMESISAAEWRNLAKRKALNASSRKPKGRERHPPPAAAEHLAKLTPQQEERITAALLGVVSTAVQGSGHFQLELERAVQQGATGESSPCWHLHQRLLLALRAAERKHRAAVRPLSHIAGQVLAVVEEHPERVAELARAFAGVGADQLGPLALRQRDAREREAKLLERLIPQLKLKVTRSRDVGAIAERVARQPGLAASWGEPEEKAIGSLQAHLRQGEELRKREDARGEGLERSDRIRFEERAKARSVRSARAHQRASELIARLFITSPQRKTPRWWKRVVRASLREIELDSLGAKRLKASRQKELAAAALESVKKQADAPTERRVEEEIAAELGRSLGKLEFELSQHPDDQALKARIAQTRELREHFLAKQKEAVRAQLSSLAESAREIAAEGDQIKEESGEWFFEME